MAEERRDRVGDVTAGETGGVGRDMRELPVQLH
jgi:hypothetical protein